MNESGKTGHARSPSASSPDIPLGVGTIMGDSFSILFRNLLPVIAIAFVPTFLALMASRVVAGYLSGPGMTGTYLVGSAEIVARLLAGGLFATIYFIEIALLVQLAYDAKLERPKTYGRYGLMLLKNIVPVTVQSVGVMVFSTLALVALIIPGLWVYATFAVVVPAVVIERCGFRGLARSFNLTKDYRWPIVGVTLITQAFAGVLDFLADSTVEVLSVNQEAWMMFAAYAAISSAGVGLSGISLALVYARLREIKEGVSFDEIASVFD